MDSGIGVSMVSYARARNIKEGVLAAARGGQPAQGQAWRGLAGRSHRIRVFIGDWLYAPRLKVVIWYTVNR